MDYCRTAQNYHFFSCVVEGL
jgi:hypothetical protein